MTRRANTIEPDYFDALYAADPDPWRFRTSDYEAGKYAATLAALSRRRYRRALEVGCSIGVFTRQLASRCERLLAIDASRVALESARTACADLDNIAFELGAVPAQFPSGSFDLIVLSEVIYYLEAPDVRRLAHRCAEALSPDGEIVACHWLGETDYPLSGAAASDLLAVEIVKRLPVREVLHDEGYRLERLSPR